MEIWKDIEIYGEKIARKYQVSNYGNVRNKMTGRVLKFGLSHGKKGKEDGIGYRFVGLTDGEKRYFPQVHRLVAIHFLPNPKNLPLVHHKDENRLNNNVTNLEFCDKSYNYVHSVKNKSRKTTQVPVLHYSTQFAFVIRYNTIEEAAYETGIGINDIECYCKTKKTPADGSIWEFA